MRVILKQDMENLGRKGDIVKVAPGYGRNYLVPQKIALEVTPSNMKMIEIEQQALKKEVEKERASYQDLIEKLNETTLSFKRRTGEKDIIFGSVSSADLKDSLHELGFEIDKKKILLGEPIKRLGNYTVPIKIFHEDRAEVKVEVVKEEEAPEKKEEKTSEEKPEEMQEAKKEPEEKPKEEELEIPKEEKEDKEKIEEKGGEAEEKKVAPEAEKDEEAVIKEEKKEEEKSTEEKVEEPVEKKTPEEVKEEETKKQEETLDAKAEGAEEEIPEPEGEKKKKEKGKKKEKKKKS